MKLKKIYLFLLILNSYFLHAQQDNSKDVALKTLYTAKGHIDSLIRATGEEFQDFNEGIVSEDQLFLFYPITSIDNEWTRQWDSTSLHGFYGFYFQLEINIERPRPLKSPIYRWIAINTDLYARWIWPNGSFSDEPQSDLMAYFERACGPLFELENQTISQLNSNNHNECELIEGPKLDLKLELEDGKDGQILLLKAKSTRADYISSNKVVHLIIDGKLWPNKLPKGFMYTLNKRGNPFMEFPKRAYLEIYRLKPMELEQGRHSIQFILSVDENTWMDLGPTLVDGAPIQKEVESAWTGRVLSTIVEIEVDDNKHWKQLSK